MTEGRTVVIGLRGLDRRRGRLVPTLNRTDPAAEGDPFVVNGLAFERSKDDVDPGLEVAVVVQGENAMA